jgi:hypothetical protein
MHCEGGNKVSDLTLWRPEPTGQIPANACEPAEVVPYAVQLTTKQKAHIVNAFQGGQYELASTFVWRKSLSCLKGQLAKLGMTFIGEMLDRPDIDELSSVDQKLTDYDALRLAEELGVLSGTSAFRLRQALEQLNHYESLKGNDAEENPMTAIEATGIVRACVDGILRLESVEAAVDFKQFRDNLESNVFSEGDQEVAKLLESPYFFHRACIRILLALVKTSNSAQLENVLANANLLIPLLWPGLKAPEKWQIGRSYSEMYAEGKSKAASGLKRALLKIRGFDFVPEDLRSTSFIKAARAIIDAHEGVNNFYNEPGPVRILEKMGTVIPAAAFPQCMTAVLMVKLGNQYNVSFDAQQPANSILKRTPKDRWVDYFNNCLPADERILYKLTQDRPLSRWIDVVRTYNLAESSDDIAAPDIKRIVIDGSKGNKSSIHDRAAKIITKLGYKTS